MLEEKLKELIAGYAHALEHAAPRTQVELDGLKGLLGLVIDTPAPASDTVGEVAPKGSKPKVVK